MTFIDELKRMFPDFIVTVHSDGYRTAYGHTHIAWCAYVELPEGHPDIGTPHEDLDCPFTNGGFTFASEDKRTFGWDYAHAWNIDHREALTADSLRDVLAVRDDAIETDVQRVLEWFREMR